MRESIDIPVDHKQRKIALDPLGSFICEAPAGSGKTELLTQRVLTLLARVEKPESVLAITFTRKAAAEMRDRILGALILGQQGEPSGDHEKTTWHLAQAVLLLDKKLAWNLLSNPNRLQIRTFDSLCAMLTQALPLHSSLGANIGISSDASALYKDAVTELMLTLEMDVPWADSLSHLLSHLDNKYYRVEELLVKMLHSRDAWLPIINIGNDTESVRAVLESYLQNTLEDKKAQIVIDIPVDLIKEIVGLGSFSASNLITLNLKSPITHLHNLDLESVTSNAYLSHDQWLAVAALLLTKTGGWRKRLDKKCGFPVGGDKHEKAAFKQKKQEMLALISALEEQPGALGALQGVSFWPTNVYRDEQWVLLQSLTNVLPVLVAQLQLVFRSHGEVDFLEMSTRAHQALGAEDEPTDLVLRLDHQIQHILADEFQDTSFSQIGLLKKLTAGWQEGDGRTLFCVGDAMQSIYGFRGANVGLFLHCKTHGLGDIHLQPLQLTTNFRSQAGVVEWVNKAFSQAFPTENNISTGAVVYSRANYFRPKISVPPIQTYLYTKNSPSNFEGESVADTIALIQKNTPQASVAILVRNKNHAKSSVQALKARGIHFRAVDLENLADQAVIQDLMSLVRALLYPEDRIAWLAVLRAPWCGLTLSDLAVLTAQIMPSDRVLVEEQIQFCLSDDSLLSCDGYQRLSRVGAILLKVVAERSRKPLRQWIEGAWLQLGGSACLTSQGDYENAERFFQCLEVLNDSGETPDIDTLVNSVNTLFAAPDPESDDRLQIMTIHKSKGLEFDVVILPGLHRRPRSQDSELLLWQERLSLDGQKEWLLAPISATGEEKDPIYQHLEREKGVREKLEACRLLYVACTRAKKQLILFAQVQGVDGEVNVFKAPSISSLLSPIWPCIEGCASTQLCDDVEAVSTQTEVAAVIDRPFVRLPANWTPPEWAEVHLLDAFIPVNEFDNRHLIESILKPESSVVRHTGTLIHQILQVIGEQGIDQWVSRDLMALEPFWLVRLMSLGVVEKEACVTLPEVRACIQKMLISKRFKWLMSGACQFEYPLTSNLSGTLKNSIIDLLMVDQDGVAWIVDYKTSQPRAGECMGHFIERELTCYREQLMRYYECIKALGFKQVKMALFFVMSDEWAEVSV